MSHEHARACVERMTKDAEFRRRVLAETDTAARTRLLSAAGFACSAEEVEALFSELSDAELDGVSGGMGINKIVVTDGKIAAKIP